MTGFSAFPWRAATMCYFAAIIDSEQGCMVQGHALQGILLWQQVQLQRKASR